MYILTSVCLKSIIEITVYAVYGADCFQLTLSSFDDYEHIFTLLLSSNQKCESLARFKPWINVMRHMSLLCFEKNMKYTNIIVTCLDKLYHKSFFDIIQIVISFDYLKNVTNSKNVIESILRSISFALAIVSAVSTCASLRCSKTGL